VRLFDIAATVVEVLEYLLFSLIHLLDVIEVEFLDLLRQVHECFINILIVLRRYHEHRDPVELFYLF
jgi:hypothetical protein